MELDHLRRSIFPDSPRHALLRRLLLAQDGSTTRLCATAAPGKLELGLYLQERCAAVPAVVGEALGGTAWLERVTCLYSGATVLMDNLSFTRLDTVPAWFLDELEQGVAPIGRLLESLFVRREAAPRSTEVEALLWNRTGLPDASMSRSYLVRLPEAPLMYIFETYRGGITGVTA